MISSEIFNMLGVDPALIMAIIIVLVLILLLAIFALIIKVNRLQSRYDLFMRGRDCVTLEDNIIEIYRKLQLMQNKDQANKDIIKVMSHNVSTSIQKTGLVKYNAFDGMGGKSSFALTLLDQKDNGFILNAMHSRNSCYLYIKQVTDGEPEVSLGKEESESLVQALEKGDRLV